MLLLQYSAWVPFKLDSIHNFENKVIVKCKRIVRCYLWKIVLLSPICTKVADICIFSSCSIWRSSVKSYINWVDLPMGLEASAFRGWRNWGATRHGEEGIHSIPTRGYNQRHYEYIIFPVSTTTKLKQSIEDTINECYGGTIDLSCKRLGIQLAWWPYLLARQASNLFIHNIFAC